MRICAWIGGSWIDLLSTVEPNPALNCQAAVWPNCCQTCLCREQGKSRYQCVPHGSRDAPVLEMSENRVTGVSGDIKLIRFN